MKIETRRTQRAAPAQRYRPSPAAPAGTAFQLQPRTEAASPAALTGLNGPAAIGAALLAQQDEAPAERRSRTFARADDLLDRLDEIRLSLLSGRIDLDNLQRLKSTLASQRDRMDDPRLEETLEAIDLRVAVELAKYHR